MGIRRRKALYEAPDIIYEGDLEVQAGTPMGIPGLDEILDDL